MDDSSLQIKIEALNRKASHKKLIFHEKKKMIEHIFPTFEQLHQTLTTYDILRHHWPLAPIISFNYQNYSLMMKDCGLPISYDTLSTQLNAFNLLPLNTQETMTHRFDRYLVIKELDLFYDWFMRRFLGYQSNEFYHSYLNLFLNFFERHQEVVLHRDFHSENILHNRDKIYLIDYQDALMGPYLYDAVSFIEDAYQNNKNLQTVAFNVFLKKYQLFSYDLITDYKICAKQRLMKMMGIFSRLSLRDKKVRYANYLPKLLKRLVEISETCLEKRFFTNLLIRLSACK